MTFEHSVKTEAERRGVDVSRVTSQQAKGAELTEPAPRDVEYEHTEPKFRWRASGSEGQYDQGYDGGELAELARGGEALDT